MACIYPFIAYGEPVPCGFCPACRSRYANQWAFRIMQEERNSTSSLWITLTYNDYSVPISENGFMTLRYSDVQKFFKRLRKSRCGSKKCDLKYYCAGEYGTYFNRPHYHVVLLNCDEKHLVSSWRDEEGCVRGDIFIDSRPLSGGAIRYTALYMTKYDSKVGFKGDDRERPFTKASNGMGLGYLTDDVVRYHYADLSRTYVTLPGNSRVALPRYYADRLFKPKSVNGHVCPVVRLAYDLMKEERSALMDTSARDRAKREYDAHIRTWGNADKFIDFNNQSRRAALSTFGKKRKDL